MATKKISKNFFTKFWYGDLSLPMSYWVVGLAGGIIVSIPVLILVIATGMPDLMMNVILLPWVIYVSVGCWCSSEKYKGPKFWSVLVKFLVIIGIISTIVQIFSGLSY